MITTLVAISSVLTCLTICWRSVGAGRIRIERLGAASAAWAAWAAWATFGFLDLSQRANRLLRGFSSGVLGLIGHRRVARRGYRGGLAALLGDGGSGAAERGLRGGDPRRGGARLAARNTGAGLKRRVGRQIGIDRTAFGARAAQASAAAARARGGRRLEDIGGCGEGRRMPRRRQLRPPVPAATPARARGAGSALRRGRTRAAGVGLAHLLEVDQHVGHAALDRVEIAEPRIAGVEPLDQLDDPVFQTAQRELIALRELHAVEPLAERAHRFLEIGRHAAAAFRQRRNPRLQPRQRFVAAAAAFRVPRSNRAASPCTSAASCASAPSEATWEPTWRIAAIASSS